MSDVENVLSTTDSLFKLKAKESLLTQIVDLQVKISHGSGEFIVKEDSLDYSIRRIRNLCEEYVLLGLFSQEEMDKFWILVNQSRYIIRTRHAVEKLAQDVEKNKTYIPDSTKSAVQDVVSNVSKFRYPKDGLLKVKDKE